MRRLALAVAVCTAFLLLASVAGALERGAGTAQHTAPVPHVAEGHAVGGDVDVGEASFSPLGARLAATTTVYGTVYDSYRVAQAGVDMEWDSWSEAEQTWYWGTGTTDGAGAYSMAARPTNAGEVYAYLANGTFGRGGRTWTEGGSDQVDLYPGRVQVSAWRGGPWATPPGFRDYTVRFFGDTEYSRGVVTAPDTSSSPVNGTIEVLDGSYSGGSVNFYWDEGVEFSTPVTVTSGATSGATVSVNEADAQRVWIQAPYWASGKPGSTVKVARNNFPVGWRNEVSGYSDPNGSAFRVFGTKTSLGGATEYVSVKIPTTAKAGYDYWIGLKHVDDAGNYLPLYVERNFQVCTMKPSKTAIARGARVRITGIVPTQGHWGSTPGKRKDIAVWWHRGTAGVPTKWDPRRAGWVFVGGMRTTATGAYTTPYFKPPRTGTFVVQYSGDDWYWGAYTSTAKVTVR
jgi:hypothetical protein